MPAPWVPIAILSGLGFLSNLLGGKRQAPPQFLPMPMPPILIPNPALYNLAAINQILGQLPGGLHLEPPPGFDPTKEPRKQKLQVPLGWESLMRSLGYGQWMQAPPVPWGQTFFDALMSGLMTALMGTSLWRYLKTG